MNEDNKEQFNKLKFRPAFFAPNSHIQTILGTLGRRYRDHLHTSHHRVALDDGDTIACEVATPPHWKPHHPTLYMVHGLGGAHDSRYMVRKAMSAFSMGHRSVRINLRGCGSGLGLCKRPYHGGLSDDIFAVIRHFHAHAPLSPSVLLGYSLGGNISLKLAGEQGRSLRNYLNGVVAVCPPYNMNRTVDKIIASRFGFYERYFLNKVKSQYKVWAKSNADLSPPPLPHRMSLIGFDDFHTAPRWGFDNARHYYTSVSCMHYISGIDLPCHILYSEDDPVCDTETLYSLSLPKSIQVWGAPKGGHMGFLGSPLHREGARWLEKELGHLVKKLL